MSDSIRHDDLQVDPRLDALLGRALGRGSVSRQQRQRHLERLGLTPRLGGSAGTWRAPVVAGRPPSPATPAPEPLSARRRRRQWAELGAAMLAVLLVGTLLVALFRDWSGSEADQQLAASPEATTPAATPTPRETREQLYVVSHAMSQNQDALITTGRVSAIDPMTGDEFWSVEAGPRIDSVLSPDGQRLFVADSGLDGDSVFALDTQTGRELWRQPVENRQWHKPGGGYSTLSVSPDGSSVSVYACEGCTGEFRSTDGRNWLAQFDAVTGNRQPDLEISACRGQTFLAQESAGVRPLYVVCDRTRRLEMVDLATNQALELTYDTFLEGGFPETTGVNAATVAPDGQWLYLTSDNSLIAIDMAAQTARRIELDAGLNSEARLPLLTLSPDGTRLYAGSLDTVALADGSAEVNRVDVYDTASWQLLGQIVPGEPLTETAFAATLDGSSVFGVSISYQPSDDTVVETTIQRLSPESETVTVTTRTNEDVLFLFAGTVEMDPDATPLPTPTPEPTAHERLFAVSQMFDPGISSAESGRVTAYDAETGSIAYAIDTGVYPDAVLSPDGTRLYILSGGVISSGGTHDTMLEAVDATSGDKNWSVAIENRVLWPDGAGPTTLAVSPDGSRLFVYSDEGPGDNTIQVFDTADGRLGRVIQGVTRCTAQLFPSADGRSLYVVCLAERFAPQVIDLEAWMSAGVMQGFGGTISGAAASTDGRYLYIPQDFDTEMSLSVIDMNVRAVSDMRSIIHLATDPLHALNITAISPDGSRLFIGVGSQLEGEAPIANEVWVWDTAMLHGDTTRLPAPDAITGWSLAPGPDNRSVFAIHNERGPDVGGQATDTATIVRLSVDGGSSEFASRPASKLLRLFSGRVTDTPEPTSTDEPDAGLPDLTIPDDLPQGLTLSSRLTTGPEQERLLFTGDEGRVVQIDIRRWTEGEVLDPPDGSTPMYVGSLTIHVTADPEGGWSRIAFWHDQRFVYSLSVLDGPPDGWTQDELLAVVTAFSSPTSAGVCPATTWTNEERNVAAIPAFYWIDGDGLSLGSVDGRAVEGATHVAWIVDSIGIADPDPDARVVMRGTRLGQYERTVPLELREHVIEWNALIGDTAQQRVRAEHHIRANVIFPTYGCWQIEAEFGGYTVQAILDVESNDTVSSLGLVWETLRWRPLHALPSEASPPCEWTRAQQVISGVGPLVGNVETNGGPAYMTGLDADGVIRIGTDAMEEGGHYAQVSFFTGGNYTGPLLVRAATGGGPIGFSVSTPDPTPATEWRLQDPADIMPTGNVRQWVVYLRLTSPGCHALQIDGLDFSSIIAFEVVADEALNEPESPAWDGSLYALSGEESNSGLVELDSLTGEVLRWIDLIPYGNSYPHLVVAPNADRLAVAAFLPDEEPTLDVLIYRLSDFTLLQRVPVPKLIQAFVVGNGIALSPDGAQLHAYQYETPPDGNGDNARYWLGTYDLERQSWLSDVELPGCGPVARMEVRVAPFVYVQCTRTGLLNINTATATVERIDDGQQTASFQHHGNKVLLLTTGGAFHSGAYWPSTGGQNRQLIDLSGGWRVASLPFHVSGGLQRLYLPIQPTDSPYPTEIAVVDLSTHTITRTIRTSAPFSEIIFAGDEQFAYVTLTGDDHFTTGIARIDLATGAETMLVEGAFGNLVAVGTTDQ